MSKSTSQLQMNLGRASGGHFQKYWVRVRVHEVRDVLIYATSEESAKHRAEALKSSDVMCKGIVETKEFEVISMARANEYEE